MDDLHVTFTKYIFNKLSENNFFHVNLRKIDVTYNKSFSAETFFDISKIFPNLTKLHAKDIL